MEVISQISDLFYSLIVEYIVNYAWLFTCMICAVIVLLFILRLFIIVS